MTIAVELEPGSEDSPVVRRRGAGYRRMRASDYMDVAARLTPRQAAFYRNLIRIAAELGSEDIPVEFELPNGHAVYLDRGCIKIAEHAGFIELLRDGASGNVETIRLTWRVNPRAL